MITKMTTVPEEEEVSSRPLQSFEKEPKAEIVKNIKSPLEATFTASNQKSFQIEEGDGSSGQSTSDKPKKQKSIDYTALVVSAMSTSSQTNSVDIEEANKELTFEQIPEDEKVLTALIALLFEVFRPLWSLGVAYWYCTSGNDTAAYIMTVLFLLNGFITHLVYFASRTSPIRKIWGCSKLLSLLCLIPFALPIVLAACNCIFAIKESKSRTYERPWTNTLTLFMVGSLTLSFPQCVLQMCLLLEHFVTFPSIPGVALLFGIVIFSIDVTFTRIRHDAHKRCERFGEKLERFCRYWYILANKVIWFCTYSIVIVSLRQHYPESHQLPIATTVSVATIFFIHEIMVILAVIPFFSRVVQNFVGLFFIFPQFVSLAALVIWVNTDKTIYDTDIGQVFLGVIFWGECIILAGWLIDRGMGKEPDFLPAYPHFTGDAFSYCCQ